MAYLEIGTYVETRTVGAGPGNGAWVEWADCSYILLYETVPTFLSGDEEALINDEGATQLGEWWTNVVFDRERR